MGAFFYSLLKKDLPVNYSAAGICYLILHHEQRYREMDNHCGTDDCRGGCDHLFLS
jgi:hypothetical protein